MIEEIRKRINESLIKSVEILEGRVPYGKEWSRYLRQTNQEDGFVVFSWKGRVILKVPPPTHTEEGLRIDLEEIDLSEKTEEWKKPRGRCLWWCKVHERPATWKNKKGEYECDPKLDGITLPCKVVFTRQDEPPNDPTLEGDKWKKE